VRVLAYELGFASYTTITVYINTQNCNANCEARYSFKSFEFNNRNTSIVTQQNITTMSPNKPAKVVFGTGSVGDTLTGDDLKNTLELFRKHGHVELDTAATYPINNFGASEKALAQQDLSWASLSTKISAMKERANSLENVRDSLATSEKQLSGKDIDILYFHMPDAVTPLEEQAAAMDEAYRAGKFKRFGISNFAPQQIEELMEIVERKGECH